MVFLGLILPEELSLILESSGFNGDYRFLYDRLKSEYPKVSFAEKPIMALGNRFFGDPSHVNKDGSRAYTEYFKKELFERYAAPSQK